MKFRRGASGHVSPPPYRLGIAWGVFYNVKNNWFWKATFAEGRGARPHRLDPRLRGEILLTEPCKPCFGSLINYEKPP